MGERSRDDIAMQLASVEDDLPEVLALGLLQMKANPSDGFSGLSEVLEFLAELPSHEETLTLRLSDVAQSQVELLLEKIK